MYRAQVNARNRINKEPVTDLAQNIIRLGYPTALSEVSESLAYRSFRDPLNNPEMECVFGGKFGIKTGSV